MKSPVPSSHLWPCLFPSLTKGKERYKHFHFWLNTWCLFGPKFCLTMNKSTCVFDLLELSFGSSYKDWPPHVSELTALSDWHICRSQHNMDTTSPGHSHNTTWTFLLLFTFYFFEKCHTSPIVSVFRMICGLGRYPARVLQSCVAINCIKI